MEDAGLYECTAVNQLGFMSNELDIVVINYPEVSFNIESETAEYTEGDEVDLICKTRGNPPPQLRLECDGNVIDESLNGEVRLHISRVTKEDAKEYVCISQNAIGEDIKYIQLMVKTRRGDAGLHDVDRNTNEELLNIPRYVYKANIGDTAILKCDVDRKHTIYVMTILLLLFLFIFFSERNNVPMRVTWERVDKNNPPYTEVQGNNLVISNIGMVASGMYQCNGIDNQGIKIPMIQALLQVMPVIQIYPNIPLIVTTGQTVDLICNATGADRISWYPENYLR